MSTDRPRVSIFIAATVDGYIARSDGSLDWLNDANAAMPASEDCGYEAFFRSVDGVVLGRHTYEQVLRMPAWPYGATPVVVLSNQPVSMPEALVATVTASAETPAALLERLHAAGHRHLYVDGGVTIQRFLREGLVDEMTITTIPILLGEGRPLFATLPAPLAVAHGSTTVYPFGFVQSRYAFHPKAPSGPLGQQSGE